MQSIWIGLLNMDFVFIVEQQSATHFVHYAAFVRNCDCISIDDVNISQIVYVQHAFYTWIMCAICVCVLNTIEINTNCMIIIIIICLLNTPLWNYITIQLSSNFISIEIIAPAHEAALIIIQCNRNRKDREPGCTESLGEEKLQKKNQPI